MHSTAFTELFLNCTSNLCLLFKIRLATRNVARSQSGLSQLVSYSFYDCPFWNGCASRAVKLMIIGLRSKDSKHCMITPVIVSGRFSRGHNEIRDETYMTNRRGPLATSPRRRYTAFLSSLVVNDFVWVAKKFKS